jgi:pimeloyl-ACP methyl ester carboxylesterase
LQRMLSFSLSLAVAAAIGYVALAALLYFTQDSSIFFPGPNDIALRCRSENTRVEIRTTRDETLEGWWVENPAASNAFVILYFGGNAEDVLYTATTLPKLGARRMLVVNYPGYGASTGRPGQEALYDYGLAVYDHALSKGVPPNDVIVMGRSLGSAVASMLAGSRPVRAAILVTPFDSLVAVASFHYPYLPIRLLLRHPFRSDEWARKSHVPALMLAAARDDIIPPAHARRLAEAWAGNEEVHVLSKAGHNDIEENAEYYQRINEFLLNL